MACLTSSSEKKSETKRREQELFELEESNLIQLTVGSISVGAGKKVEVSSRFTNRDMK